MSNVETLDSARKIDAREMTTFATITLICPHCGQKYCYQTMLSTNNMGIVYFSDMKNDGDGTTLISIFKCSQCKHFVWVRDMKRNDKSFYGSYGINGTAEGELMQPLSIQELAEALAAGVAKDKAEEQHLRFAIWWLFNDRIRSRNNKSIPTKVALWKDEGEQKLWHENLDALCKLLDSSDASDQLIQVEILREQERFGQAIDLLGEICNPEGQAIRLHCRLRNPFVFSFNGENPLHKAARESVDVEVLKNLVSQGARAESYDLCRNMPMHHAARYNSNLDILKYLISQWGYVKAKGSGDNTLLHYAAESNPNVEVLKYLIERGTNVNAKDICGRTPLDIADTEEKRNILREAGGKSGKELDRPHKITPSWLHGFLRWW